MLTIETLKEFGADVTEGIEHCMGNSEFYVMMVKKATEDKRIKQLEKQINDHDLTGAFDTAHALKGLFANLSLTPISSPINEITELLRNRTETDYSELIEEAKKQFELLSSL